MTQLHFEQLHPDFGAKVSGINLNSDLEQEKVEIILKALDCYSLLCFPDQSLTDKSQLDFTCRLGQPEVEHVRYGKTGKTSYFGTVGNVLSDGTKLNNKDSNTRYQKGNDVWHSDSSFREIPSIASIAHAHEIPGEGGDTQFASMRTAYSRLSDVYQKKIDNLICIHDYVFSRSRYAAVDPNHAASLPPVQQKLVRTNPNNGKKNYYVGSHARSIVGWKGIQSRKLIDDLLIRSTRPKDIYSHKWSVGDTVIWDNRCLLHRGTGYDADRWRRLIRQTRVAGTGSTLDE